MAHSTAQAAAYGRTEGVLADACRDASPSDATGADR